MLDALVDYCELVERSGLDDDQEFAASFADASQALSAFNGAEREGDGWRIANLTVIRTWVTEIASTTCPECGADRARGDESGIVYCGTCGHESHPGDDDYPFDAKGYPMVVLSDGENVIARLTNEQALALAIALGEVALGKGRS